MEDKKEKNLAPDGSQEIEPSENKFVENYFEEVVGQDRLKRLLTFYITAFQKTQILPHLFLVGQKGGGKTYLAHQVARNLRVAGLNFTPKPMLTVNSGTIKSVKNFVEDIYLPYIQGKYITIFFDEAHDLPSKVQTALLTVLNPNKNNQTRLFHSDGECHFDFRNVSFIFATTDPQAVLTPLKDRCRMCHMNAYNIDELAKIITINLDIEVERPALEAAASVCRGNARNAVLMSKDNISQFTTSHSIKNFTLDHWNTMKEVLGILPLGLEDSELQILKALEPEDRLSLTGLSAKTGLSRMSLQREFEDYLLKHGLICIETNGRSLTKKGREYLKNIKF